MEQLSETIRNEESINALINTAIIEAVDLFESELTSEEKTLLLAVVDEKHTGPRGRVSYLRQQVKEMVMSSVAKEVVNSILLTLRQKLNSSEKEMLCGIQTQMLDDVE
ncbi:MAG: hypothetical protein MUF19_00070 [Candidatus Pacebacteria bacterium]|jgi:hypothetical protein|nr:hypothetical protein [Candidatus Paceibacterota bacterium]